MPYKQGTISESSKWLFRTRPYRKIMWEIKKELRTILQGYLHGKVLKCKFSFNKNFEEWCCYERLKDCVSTKKIRQ